MTSVRVTDARGRALLLAETRVKLLISGARGPIGLDLAEAPVAGKYLVWDAYRRVRNGNGTGADAGLRDDLAAAGGIELVNGGVTHVSDRTTLALYGTAEGRIIWLGEAGREGFFTWRSGDHSGEVDGDPYQGLYVATSTNIGGTTGAWVRAISRELVLTWWGADPTNTVSASNAVDAAIYHMMALNTPLHVPFGRYKMTRPWILDMAAARTVGFMLTGVGVHQSVFDFTGVTDTPNFLLTCTTADCFYPMILDIGVEGNVAGRLGQLGPDDYSAPINKPVMRIGFQNFNATSSMIGLVANYVLNGDLDFQVNGGTGGYIGGLGRAVVARQMGFNRIFGSVGTCDIAWTWADGVNFGNELFLDMENVNICVSNESLYTAPQLFHAGQWSYSTYGARSLHDTRIIIDAPNPAPNGTATAADLIDPANYAGLQVRGRPPGFSPPAMPASGTIVPNNTGRDAFVDVFGDNDATLEVIGGGTYIINTPVLVHAGESVKPVHDGSGAWIWREA